MMKEFKVTNDILATAGQRLANLFLDRFFYVMLTTVYGVLLGIVAGFLEDNQILTMTESELTSFLISLLFYFVMYFILEATNTNLIS